LSVGPNNLEAMAFARTTRAFTLVEAVVAMGVMSVAAAALLLGINSAQQTTSLAEQQATALGIAQQLLDEVTGTLIYAAGTAPGVPGTGVNRTLFTNVDSFNGFGSQPPLDPWGIALGTDNGAGGQRHPNFFVPNGSLKCWLEQISVYYVSSSDLVTPLAKGQTSNYRVVQVTVFCVDPTLGPVSRASVSQVVTYVPPMQ
jgi:type II secretory pathway pseudopilin PulG